VVGGGGAAAHSSNYNMLHMVDSEFILRLTRVERVVWLILVIPAYFN